MMPSNYTLKFPRSGREAFGHDCRFVSHRPDPDRIVGYTLLALAIFAAGVVFGGAL
jgi:hypothetical protein